MCAGLHGYVNTPILGHFGPSRGSHRVGRVQISTKHKRSHRLQRASDFLRHLENVSTSPGHPPFSFFFLSLMLEPRARKRIVSFMLYCRKCAGLPQVYLLDYCKCAGLSQVCWIPQMRCRGTGGHRKTNKIVKAK